MIPRTYSMYGLVFAVLFAGLVAGNFYFSKSGQEVVQPVQPEMVSPVQESGNDFSKNIVGIINTEQTIWSSSAPEVAAAESRESRPLMNPFLWPEERVQLARQEEKAVVELREKAAEEVVARAEEEATVILPQLKMIIIGENKKVSLLDNTYVHEGETYNDFLVKEIRGNEVVLLGSTGEKKIAIEEEMTYSWLTEQLESSKKQQQPELMQMDDEGMRAVQDQVEMMNNVLEKLKPFLQEGGR